jgi:hypothetical protein
MKLLILLLLTSPALLRAHQMHEKTERIPFTTSEELSSLMQGQTILKACENVAKFLSSRKEPANHLTTVDLKNAATLIADHFNTTDSEPMLCFAGLQIPAALDWVQDDPQGRNELRTIYIGSKCDRYACDSGLVLAILNSKPELAKDTQILRNAMRSDDLPLISYLVNRPDLRDLLTQQYSMHELAALCSAFPLRDPEKARILAKALGGGTVLRALNLEWTGLISADAQAAIMKESLNSPDDFLRIVHKTLLLKHPLHQGTMELRDENGNTILMKFIEYRDKYTDSGLASLSRQALCDVIAASEVNAVNVSGETALIKATKKGDAEAIRLLLWRGANFYLCDNENNRAEDYARGNANLEKVFQEFHTR